MQTRKVIVVPYDINWKLDFEKIKEELQTVVGDLVLSIEHVGSTAVEGLSAKPCIDIDIVIKDYSVFDNLVQRLAEFGYIHEGDLGIKDREAFTYNNKDHLQKHHLYVCPQYSKELYRHITFREFLKNNPSAVKEYSLIKETAAKIFPNDINKYIEYKTPCILQIYKKCGLN